MKIDDTKSATSAPRVQRERKAAGRYEAAQARRSVSARALKDFVDKVFDGAVGPVFAQLIQDEKISDAELEDMMKIIRKERDK